MGREPQGRGVKEPIHKYDDLDVYLMDIYKLLDTEIDEIDTGALSSPQTILTPPSGHYICVRGVSLFTDSSSGEIAVTFKNSGSLLAKLYPSRYASTTLPKIHKHGQVDEPLELSWDGLSVGSKIFYVILYKFIKG